MFEKFHPITLVFLASAALATPAAAEWHFQEQGSAFDEKKIRVAIAVRPGYAFAFRCTGKDDLDVAFITPEAVEQDAVETLNAVQPEILVRVDDNEIITIPAVIDTGNTEMVLRGVPPTHLATQVIEASSGVSVAVRVIGQLYHEQEFDVLGSTKSVQDLLKACSIAPE